MTNIWIGRNGLSVPQEGEAVARQTISGNARTYFVRAANDGQLFNPLDATATLTERDKERGGRKYVLRRCSETTYQRYIEFLTTRNKANLLVAERAFKDEHR